MINVVYLLQAIRDNNLNYTTMKTMTEINVTASQIWKVEESGSFYIPITMRTGEKMVIKINDNGNITDANAAKFLDFLHMGLNLKSKDGFNGIENLLAMNGISGIELEGAVKVEDFIAHPESELDLTIVKQCSGS